MLFSVDKGTNKKVHDCVKFNTGSINCETFWLHFKKLQNYK